MFQKRLKAGLVHVYTGEGKGKTTAALGQALRMIGRGYSVDMIQFLKGKKSGELYSSSKLEPCFKIYRLENIKKFFWTLEQEEKYALKKNIEEMYHWTQEIIKKEECDLLILDEIMGVITNQLIPVEKVCDLIQNKPKHMEMILTGRNAPQSIIDLADYVSDIKAVKHPFEKGIGAREGIEY